MFWVAFNVLHTEIVVFGHYEQLNGLACLLKNFGEQKPCHNKYVSTNELYKVLYRRFLKVCGDFHPF